LRQLSNIYGIATTKAYFSMFDVPFKYGSAWGMEDENKRAKVAVLSQKISRKLFGDGNPVNRLIRLGQDDYRIVGVVGDWNPIPRYTNVILSDDEYVGEDEIYLPFQTAIDNRIDPYAGFECGSSLPEPGFQGQLDTECTWIQFWFEANSATQIKQIKVQLDNYTEQQHQQGRFPRKANNKLLNVMEWLDCLELVDGSYKIATGLSFSFLVLCMVNTIGLLLAKFSTRATEVGVRRALGASKLDIFTQFLVETMVVGLAGGILGLMLSFAALWIIAQQTKQFMVVAHMDVQMMMITFGLSVLSSVLAGLFPIWRACQITPALQLKTQ
jgi:putative ABC transport system permease protein